MVFIYILLCLVSVVLVALVLMQESKSGLGGITGGATMNTFGANTDKALIKATTVAGILFFVLVITIHLVNKGDAPQKSLMPEASKTTKTETTSNAAETTPVSAENGTSVTIPIKDIENTSTEQTPEASTTQPEKAPAQSEDPKPTAE